MSIGNVELLADSNGGVIFSIFCTVISENNSWLTVVSPLVTIGSSKIESKVAQPVSSLGIGSIFSPQGLEGNALETKQKILT